MSFEAVMAILAASAQVSGYSVAEVLRQVKKKPEKKLLSLNLIRLLSVFDDDNDPLTGLWTINRWDYEFEIHSGYIVSGSLAVLYRVPGNELWRGTLFLKYCRRHSDKGWVARRRGYLIESGFSAEIRKKSMSTYEGLCTQIYRNPKREITISAEFSDIHLVNGRLVGKFINTNMKGEADVVFHQRKRWKETDITAL